MRAGDIVELEVLEGRGQTTQVPVIEIVERYVSTQAVMQIDAVNRLLDEAPVVSGFWSAAESARSPLAVGDALTAVDGRSLAGASGRSASGASSNQCG